jgi:SAM-dependent methyltransferase
MIRTLADRFWSAVAGDAQKRKSRTNQKVQEAQRELPVFPRFTATASALTQISRKVWEPQGLYEVERIRMLEAKVEYLLDEIYRLKSIQRVLPGAVEVMASLRDYQVSTFDYQWANIPYHDEFLSNPDWIARAPLDAAERAGVAPEWFRNKKVLDCGCGPGRYAWALASLGASVTAFDLSDRGLAEARERTASFSDIRIDKLSILEPLPYATDFDMVFCYGVLHHTGDTLGGLRNIARHVKPGGRIYLMLYAEPRRNNRGDYQYRHEISTLREATREMPFSEKAKICEQIDGPTKTQQWFDAISSEINDLYTFEEIKTHLQSMGFSDVKRTMPHEDQHNVAAIRTS